MTVRLTLFSSVGDSEFLAVSERRHGLVVAALVYAAISILGCSSQKQDTGGTTLLELHNLSRATTAFQARYGHRPPKSTVRSLRKHIISVDPHYDFDELNLDELLQLDNAERLVFWLGGATSNDRFGFDRHRCFDFAESQLVDRDNDGFLEYAAPVGGVFEYDDDAERVSCDFSDDKRSVTIDPAGVIMSDRQSGSE